MNYGSVVVYTVSNIYSQSMGYFRRSLSFLSYVPRALWALLSEVFKREGRPNVVYASSTPLTVPAVAYAINKVYRIPYVFEAVDVWPQVPIGMHIINCKPLANTLHTLTDFLYEKASHIVTLSEGMKSQIMERNIESDKVSVVHNGTNTSVFFYNGQPKNGNTFIYAGSMGAANNVDFLMDAALSVGGHWWIYGDGSQKSMLLKRARIVNSTLGYDCVKFFSPVPKHQLNDVLNRANVGVSVFANYPVLEANAANKFYDYLAAGLPVLTNYRGWQADVIEQYNCGYAAKQGDLYDFVNGAKFLAHSEACPKARWVAEHLFDRRHLSEMALDILIACAK
jgi:glycosyltransferase involved in cell wall biosynthesis